MKKTAYILFILITLFSACQKTQNQSNVGFLYISNIGVNADVVSVESKAPATSEFTVIIKEKGTGEVVYSGGVFSDIKTFSAGDYTVLAYSGNYVNVALDAPYYYGEKDITVQALKKTNISLTVAMAGSTIEAAYPSDIGSHFQSGYYLNVTAGGANYSVLPGHKLFVKTGLSASVALKGINALGEAVEMDFGSISSVEAMKNYKYSVSLSLPVFSMPAQVATDVWASKVYLTTLASSNISQGNASKILSGAVYEISSDGVNWASSTTVDGKTGFAGLSAGTSYAIRAKYGAVVSSNTVNVTTEVATQIENNSFESWSKGGESHTLYPLNNGSIYCYFAGSSAETAVWSTRNTLSTNGLSSAGNTQNVATYWRWYSGTYQTSDCSNGSSAAEISTQALYTGEITSTWLPYYNSNDKVRTLVNNSNNVHVGVLFTGSYNKDSDVCTVGISHLSRPQSISFDYKYAPYPSSDVFLAYAVLYDSNGNQIASTGDFNGSSASSYTKKTLDFTYTNKNVKASKIGVYFASGNKIEASNTQLIEGGYGSSPKSKHRFLGSILKIDNVILNY